MAPTRSTDAAVYRKAAQIVADTRFMFVTTSLHRAAGSIDAGSALCGRMGEVFESGWADWTNKERIFALLFMAAMVEAGDA